jgi:ISXO2-like transposase domain
LVEQPFSSGYTALSGGPACFGGVSAVGCLHTPIVASGRKPDELPEFRWINTVLGNVNTGLIGVYHAFDLSKYAGRYLSAIAYRFNHRFQFKALLERLLVAEVATGPWSEAWIWMAEDSC